MPELPETRENYTFNGITIIVHERKDGQVFFHRKNEGDPDDWEHCELLREDEAMFDYQLSSAKDLYGSTIGHGQRGARVVEPGE